ncbi:Hsp20/alpha crystallin family protein [Acidipropionibacterium jensenii]|uniref:Hsp20/alpha crystallin family protein n=1 Tax=Acidipropionibacterium jensenii TaxID=1749 RepID=UPI002648BD11|nr:Hsp20/alpha crystallin family protein [Acidipropionibacterium jensenii]MDN5995208.1 Hsp20/alpha crystallin family protein [Acidipropionibacterium jensenii]
MARTFDSLSEMDRLFSGVSRTPASVAMPMDLYRDGDSYVAELDLPGVDPASIDIDIDGQTLTIRAERSSHAGEQSQWLTRERAVGTFARQLTLGNGLATDQIGADYSDGVLRLTIPVAEAAKPRKISVRHRVAARAGWVRRRGAG